jgi:hypothetical protein
MQAHFLKENILKAHFLKENILKAQQLKVVYVFIFWWGIDEGDLREFFIYFFYHDFAKLYGPPEILQNYTSAVVTHGVRNITPPVVGP